MPLETPLDLPVFQGPLDLLLTLIERRRLAITDVSLAMVADQYLQAVRSMPEPDPDLLGEFLVIGARLLLLKSRALLPQPEEADEEEPFDDLSERLEEYRRFKEVAQALAARFESGRTAFPHSSRSDYRDYQPPLAPIEAAALARLWRSISHRQPAPPIQQLPTEPRVPVAARLVMLRRLLSAGVALRWEEVAGETLDEVIATFLAVLELVRQHELRLRQESSFQAIWLESVSRPPTAINGEAARNLAAPPG